MQFLIQTNSAGRIEHDFAFTLMESVRYNNWLNNNKAMEILLTDCNMFPGYIPIGSVEFVCDYLRKYYHRFPGPINIPDELMGLEFTGRNVINGKHHDIQGRKFVKSNSIIKMFTEICTEAPCGNYQISDVIDIDSEWRSFVYNGELVGLQNYGGEFDMFPDVNKIKEMIAAYKSAPVAYTLDVGIVKGDTVIIEVHDFFSCGLYGFADHRKLPFMFERWFNEYINKK